MKNLCLLLALCFTNSLFAQSYTLLGEDAAGDPTINGIVDLRSISYAVDESADSLWFKLEFHDNLPGDIGVVFGVDTDLVLDNGLNWNSSNNTDLSPEVVFTINRNFIDPTSLYGFSNNDLNQTSIVGANDSSIIVNMQLSNLDADGRFNFVLGSSTFDCDVNNRTIFDDLPETGYFSIDLTTSVAEIEEATALKVFPNPVNDHFYLDQSKAQAGQTTRVYNANGQLVLELSKQSKTLQKIDCADWKSGIYFLSVWDGKEFKRTKLVKL
ncbi:MAG: T9SS type A sorting domain-containing protein [Saprospiraceae bacterium]